MLLGPRGGGVAVCFRSDTKSGGEGGGAACRTMIFILVCARARDNAWGMERGGGGGGGGGNWSQRAAFHMNGGGGAGGRPPPEPMVDPGLVLTS